MSPAAKRGPPTSGRSTLNWRFTRQAADLEGREAAPPHQRQFRQWVKLSREANMKKSESPSRLIDARIKELGDWRGEMLGRLRALIKAANPDVVEEWKWSVPVWSHDGLICTGETYKSVVKMTFAKGAALK